MQIRTSNKVTGSFPSIYSCLSVWAWGMKLQTGFSCCWKVLISVCLTESSRWGILDRTCPVLVQNTVPYNRNTQTWAWVCSRPGWFEYLPRNCCVSNSLDGRQEAEMAGDVQRLRSCFTSLGKKRETPTEAFPRPDSDSTGPVNWERSVKERDDILQELLFTEPRMFHGPASLPGQRWWQMSVHWPRWVSLMGCYAGWRRWKEISMRLKSCTLSDSVAMTGSPLFPP